MTVAILLDQPALPEQGAVNINLHCTFEIKVTAEQARRQVKQWLFKEVAMTLTSQAPTLLIGSRIVWRVPVVFTSPQIGTVGAVGEIDVDVATGAMDNSPNLKTMLLEQSRELAATMSPYQPRTVPPQPWLVKDFQPTHPAEQPIGNPLDLLPAVT